MRVAARDPFGLEASSGDLRDGAGLWEQRCRWLHAALLLLACSWMALVVVMSIYARKQLSDEVLHVSHSGLICGLSSGLCTLLVMSQGFLFSTAFCPFRCWQRLRELDSTSDKWCIMAFMVAIVQVISQTFCAFLFVTNYLFNVLGLSMASCLAQKPCNTGLDHAPSSYRDVSWVRAFNRMSPEDKPYVGIAGTIQLTGKEAHLSEAVAFNKNSSFVGIEVNVAVPNMLRLQNADVSFMVFLFVWYWLSLGCLLVYVVVVRTWDGHTGRINRFVQELYGLPTLEIMSIVGFLVLAACATQCIFHFRNVTFGYPLFLGIASIIGLLHLRTTRLRMPQGRPYTTWQKRYATGNTTGLVSGLTYTAGLTLSLFLCQVANVWPEKFEYSLTQTLFVLSMLAHVGLTIGYHYSIHAHLELAKYREPRLLQAIAAARPNCGSLQTLNLSGNEIGDERAQAEFATPNGSFLQSPDDPYECSICMDAKRSVALRPCGHANMCETCAQAVMRSGRSVCPTCQGRIDDVLRIYF